MRSFYSDYAQHCIKFYMKYPDMTVFKTDADKQNWKACRDVISKLNESEQFAMRSLYQNGDTLADNIYQFCKNQNIPQDSVWDLVRKVEYKIAKRRGLI